MLWQHINTQGFDDRIKAGEGGTSYVPTEYQLQLKSWLYL